MQLKTARRKSNYVIFRLSIFPYFDQAYVVLLSSSPLLSPCPLEPLLGGDNVVPSSYFGCQGRSPVLFISLQGFPQGSFFLNAFLSSVIIFVELTIFYLSRCPGSLLTLLGFCSFRIAEIFSKITPQTLDNSGEKSYRA